MDPGDGTGDQPFRRRLLRTDLVSPGVAAANPECLDGRNRQQTCFVNDDRRSGCGPSRRPVDLGHRLSEHVLRLPGFIGLECPVVDARGGKRE